MKIGIQTQGQSSDSIKKMALKAFLQVEFTRSIQIADIGAGRGDIVPFILPYSKSLTLVDDFDPKLDNDAIKFVKTDLNKKWDLEDNFFDFVFSLEVIEHLENPRHFFKEINRILKPDGYGFVSTPNSSNLFSRLLFLMQGENRYFQDNSYPAHISCLQTKDFSRILMENHLELISFFYNGEDSIPFIGIGYHLPFAATSNSFGVLFHKAK